MGFQLFHVTAQAFRDKLRNMTTDTVAPILETKDLSAPLGRRADLLASALACIGAGLSIIAAIWFFGGFAENDTRPEHLFSALLLTCILFAFAIIPFGTVAWFARQAHRQGTKRTHLFWTIFLMLPWIGLGLISVIYTPLPPLVGVIMAGLAGLLTLWALVSLVLDWNAEPVNTLRSQQDEVQNAPEQHKFNA